jgi:hypothetical protein
VAFLAKNVRGGVADLFVKRVLGNAVSVNSAVVTGSAVANTDSNDAHGV